VNVLDRITQANRQAKQPKKVHIFDSQGYIGTIKGNDEQLKTQLFKLAGMLPNMELILKMRSTFGTLEINWHTYNACIIIHLLCKGFKMIEILEQGRNTTTIGIGNKRIYFSYKTPIAFYTPSGGYVVRQNDWGVTTGKHLNAIDGGNKAARVSGEVFEGLLNSEFNQ